MIVKERKVKPKQVTFPRKQKLQYYEISVKTGKNIENGFHHLIRTLMGDKKIQFASRSAQQHSELKSDVKKAAANPLPAADDADGLWSATRGGPEWRCMLDVLILMVDVSMISENNMKYWVRWKCMYI